MRQETKESFIWNLLFFALFIALYTEFLSIFNAINKLTVITGWIFFIALFYFVKKPSIHINSIKKFFFKKDNSLYNYFIFLVIFISFLICIIYPPNNTDALSYRLPKVEQWIQNKSLDIFPTSDLRQAMYPSFSEYIILHFKLIFNSYFFVNFIQLLSMIVSIITISLISLKLGCKNNNIIFGLIFCISIPMGILQSNSSQTDYLVTSWIIICIYFIISFINENKFKYIVGISISLGLATLTKPTAYIFLFPFFLWLLFDILKNKKKNFKYLLIIPIIFVGINGGLFFRNFEIFSYPLGSNAGMTNELMSLKVVISNLVRNISLNLTFPSVEMNSFVRNVVYNFHEMINLSINDQINTFSNEGKYGGDYFIYFSLFENTASNMIHFLIIFFVSIFSFTLFKDYNCKIYLLCLLVSFLLFSIILKWQPWGNRLLLPFFVLFSPLISFLPTDKIRSKILNIISCVLILYSLPYLFMNKTRPLIGNLDRIDNRIIFTKPIYLKFDRENLYFVHQDNQIFLNKQLVIDQLNNSKCKNIGIISDDTEIEFLLWFITKKVNYKDTTLFHLNVDNPTKRNDKNLPPCGVFLMNKTQKNQQYLKKIFKNFIKSSRFDYYY